MSEWFVVSEWGLRDSIEEKLWPKKLTRDKGCIIMLNAWDPTTMSGPHHRDSHELSTWRRYLDTISRDRQTSCSEAEVAIPCFSDKTLSIPIRRGWVQDSYRFSQLQLHAVIMRLPCKVCSGFLVNESNSSWSCPIRPVLCFTLPDRGAIDRVVIISSISKIATTVQPEGGSECQNPSESEDTSHIARREFT